MIDSEKIINITVMNRHIFSSSTEYFLKKIEMAFLFLLKKETLVNPDTKMNEKIIVEDLKIP